jgi:membrane protease subunit HflK
MRRAGPPSEFQRLTTPVVQVLDAAWQHMHWWIAAMAMLYALSGITIIRADEVAVLLRWGRLVGATPALQEHGPGLLFAFPRPIDRVIRVQVKRIREASVASLGFMPKPSVGEPEGSDDEQPAAASDSDTLNPLLYGYALTGDHNVVQLQMIAHYRVREAALWALYGPNTDDVLRTEVTGAMVRSLGEMGIDSVLSDGRKALVATATDRAQSGLDAARSGLELTSLELRSLSPARALIPDFNAVQGAYIAAETSKKEALAFAATAVPEAQSQVDASLQAARGTAAADLARAQGEGEAFRALAHEYRANPAVVKERLYRDAVERATLAAGSIQWVPPPSGSRYNGFRITINASNASGGGQPDDWHHP